MTAAASPSFVERLRQLRSALSFLLVLSWMAFPCGPIMYLVAIPLCALLPSWRSRIALWYFRMTCAGIFFFFKLGGARFSRIGQVDTRGSGLVVMNHQSLLDIPALSLMATPAIPAFIARQRYGHWYVPLVGGGIWLIDGPLIDPKRDSRGAVDLLARLASTQQRTFALFPEGHRSKNGELGGFRTGGLLAILREQPGAPVTLVVTDGFWKARTFVDFITNVHHLRGRTEVAAVLEAPTDPAALPAFVERIEARMREHLAQMRARASADGAAAGQPALPA